MCQVLLVDDNAVQLHVREAILRGAGFTVQLAASADSALELMRSAANNIAVVVTDHNLPGRSGVDLVRELRQNGITLPVIVLTGMPGIENLYKGLNVIIREKPFPAVELIHTVRNFL